MQAARELAECGTALREAKDGTATDESAAAWLSGPFAHRVRAVEAFALQRADAKETQLALETLQVCWRNHETLVAHHVKSSLAPFSQLSNQKVGRRPLCAIHSWLCCLVQAAGVVPGTGGAAALLGRIGVWGPHDHIGLRQLNLTREFPPALEARLQANPPLHRLVMSHMSSDVQTVMLTVLTGAQTDMLSFC